MGVPLGSTRYHQRAGENPLKESVKYKPLMYINQEITCLFDKQFFVLYRIVNRDTLL